MDTQSQLTAAPLSKIISVASVAAGVQFGWALQLSLLTPYVQTLGVPHTWAAFIWLCGPLSGLLVQPTVGYYSDRCTSRLGRRRPFIIGGATLVALAVFLIGFAKDIGYNAGDDIKKETKPRAVAVFVIGFWILDVANNMLQGPCRALLADLCLHEHKQMRLANGFFSFFMALGNVLGYAAGSYSKLYNMFPFTKTDVCDASCANLKSCFVIDIVLLICVTILSTCSVKEIPFIRNEKNVDENSMPFIGELVTSFKQMERPMWILLLVTFFNWLAWFPFVLYDTDWMGREVYGGSPDGSQKQKDIYDLGVRAGSLGLMLNSIVLGFASLAVEPLGQLLGGVKKLWGLVNIILAGGLVSMVIVAKVAESWRETHGLMHPAADIKGAALFIFSILGIPLAITYSIPFALASIYCSMAGAGQGLSLGVVNLAIVLPQMVISVVAGPLDAMFGGGNSAAFILGAISAIVSVVLSLKLLPNPPADAEAPDMIVAGGGH